MPSITAPADAAVILASIDANLRPLFNNITNNTDLASLPTFDNIWEIITNAISETIPYLVSNTVTNGNDPQGGVVVGHII